MNLVRAFAALGAALLAVPACGGATPSPRSVEDCDERTVLAFWEKLEGDTIFVRHWPNLRPSTRCRDGEPAASCEARARAKLPQKPSPEGPVYSCTNEPGATCWVARHDEDVWTLRNKMATWDDVAEALFRRWGYGEVDLLVSSSGKARAARAFARLKGEGEGEKPSYSILLHRSDRARAREEIKAAARGWSALKIGSPYGVDGGRWLRVPIACRPKNKPHPSAHKGPWHCMAGPRDPQELVPNECSTTENLCASGREHLMQEVRLRGGRSDDVGPCSPAPRVYCFEMESEYADIGGWQSYRSYSCYPSRERCELVRPETPLHARVMSGCFEAGGNQ